MANEAGNSNKLMWILGFFMLILCGLTAVNVILLLDNRSQQSGAEEVTSEEKIEPIMPIFVSVGPMTVNLQNDGYGKRLLYAGLSLRVRDEATQEQLTTHMPEVHSRLLVLLSDQRAEDMEKASGKEQLATQILTLFEQPLAEGWPQPLVDAVFFTDFIVQ